MYTSDHRHREYWYEEHCTSNKSRYKYKQSKSVVCIALKFYFLQWHWTIPINHWYVMQRVNQQYLSNTTLRNQNKSKATVTSSIKRFADSFDIVQNITSNLFNVWYLKNKIIVYTKADRLVHFQLQIIHNRSTWRSVFVSSPSISRRLRKRRIALNRKAYCCWSPVGTSKRPLEGNNDPFRRCTSRNRFRCRRCKVQFRLSSRRKTSGSRWMSQSSRYSGGRPPAIYSFERVEFICKHRSLWVQGNRDNL